MVATVALRKWFNGLDYLKDDPNGFDVLGKGAALLCVREHLQVISHYAVVSATTKIYKKRN